MTKLLLLTTAAVFAIGGMYEFQNGNIERAIYAKVNAAFYVSVALYLNVDEQKKKP